MAEQICQNKSQQQSVSLECDTPMGFGGDFKSGNLENLGKNQFYNSYFPKGVKDKNTGEEENKFDVNDAQHIENFYGQLHQEIKEIRGINENAINGLEEEKVSSPPF